jgi:hypothetical protein
MRRFVSLSGWKSSGDGAASQSAIVGVGMGHAWVRGRVETGPVLTSISVHLHDENTTILAYEMLRRSLV